MPEFDAFATDYATVLNASLGASGEGALYFADHKAAYLIDRVVASPTARILDYGCGVGLLAAALRKRMSDAVIHGYDPSAASIEAIPEPLRAAGLFTDDEADLANGYDVVILANVLHHVPLPERQAVIARALERLRTGGRLVVFELNPFNPLTRRVVADCVFDKDAILLPAREVVDRFGQFFLQDVRRDYTVFFPRAFRILRPLEPALAWCPLGAQYAVTGRSAARKD